MSEALAPGKKPVGRLSGGKQTFSCGIMGVRRATRAERHLPLEPAGYKHACCALSIPPRCNAFVYKIHEANTDEHAYVDVPYVCIYLYVYADVYVYVYIYMNM